MVEVSTSLTESQLQVVHTAGSCNLLVDAGAGSGKTTTVVQAICQVLGVGAQSSRTLSLEDIAAITFTRQAAADLKRKLRSAFRSAGRRDLAEEVDAARIGTIHSFCSSLLSEFALRTGARPLRRVIEEGESALLLSESAGDVINAELTQLRLPGLHELFAVGTLRKVNEWIIEAAGDAERLAEWRKRRKELRPHESALLELATRTASLHRSRLRNEGAADFDMLIAQVRTMLRDDSVRHAVQRSIRFLVLDEFQDVDPVQNEIAFLLAGAELNDPSPTRLLLVGDPKQSIYAFRRADVAGWNDTRRRLEEEGSGQRLQLRENFRSKAAILAFVDAAIGPSLERPVHSDGVRRDFEVEYSPLDARAPDSSGDSCVELLITPPTDSGKALTAGVSRELEAQSVAMRMQELHREGTPYGSMAILLSSWRDVSKYEEALRASAIPFYVLRGEGFWERREVLDVMLALRAIRDPRDLVARAGFLKSPFAGVRDDTLTALRESDFVGELRGESWDAEENALLRRGHSLLQRFAPLRDRVPVHELILALLEESGYLAYAASLADGMQCVANLRKLVARAGAAPDQSLGDFLRGVEELRRVGSREAQERLYQEQGEVVTVTSIHSAKGLEWPIVFWCDLRRSRRSDTSQMLAHRALFRIRLPSPDPTDGDETDPEYDALRAELELESHAEAKRLWYVAATRARERLILSGVPRGTWSDRKKISPAALLLDTFPELAESGTLAYSGSDGMTYHATVREVRGFSRSMNQTHTPPQLCVRPRQCHVLMGRVAVSATLLRNAMADARDIPGAVARTPGRAVLSSAPIRDTAASPLVGSLVHQILEHADYNSTDLDELVEEALASYRGDDDSTQLLLGSEVRRLVRERVGAALQSPLWQEVASLPGSRREVWFTYFMEDGTVCTGSIDLLAFRGREAVVVDIKNSGGSDAALAERYRIQGAVYADAVATISGVEGVSVQLLTLPEGRVVPIPAGIAEARAIVRDAVRWLRSDSPPGG